MRRVILASSSRYRRELLERLRLVFDCVAPAVDEAPMPRETPCALALRLSQAKARKVAQQYPQAVVIGSDQVLELQGEPMGKPGTFERAVEQLRRLSGQTVQFHTGVTVTCLERTAEMNDVAIVRVRFRTLSASEIRRYVEIEQPLDCTGGAKSEGLGIALLESIESDDPTALVGLPLIRTAHMLRTVGGIQLP